MSKTLIIYGSLTSNTQFVAEKIFEKLQALNPETIIKNVVEANPTDLETADTLILGASTWDDGLVQYDFADFLKDLENEKPDLTGKKLATFGCGDTSYEHYCVAVDIIEKEAAKLGAKIIIKNLKIDGFPQSEENINQINEWSEKLIRSL